MARERTGTGRAGRWLLLATLLGCAAAAYWLAGDRLSYQGLRENYRSIEAWREANPVLAAGAFAAAYVAVVAFSIPGAVWLTLLGGFMFGAAGGAALVVVSATVGATLIFLAARTVLARPLRARAGDWISRLERGFRQGEVSFLLVMRLVPAVPFFIANLVPAFLGARTRSFVWTTFVGIIPATLVFVSLGAGLGEQLERGERPDPGMIFEPRFLLPMLGLALLAAMPVLLRWMGIRGPGTEPAE